jgi:acyl-CoA hydrolase
MADPPRLSLTANSHRPDRRPAIRPGAAEDVLNFVAPGADLIVPLANGEPPTLLDVLESHQENLKGVRIHQMHALEDRAYIRGEFEDRLRHVSYFLSAATRAAYWAGGCDLVPSNFSEVPALLR